MQEALDEAGVEYEIVRAETFPRGRRKEVIAGTGQHFLPAIEFEDGSWYRADSHEMAAVIRAGKLDERGGRAPASERAG